MRDRLVVITGAGSGIGRAAALRFAGGGSEVIVADIDGAGAAATVRQIEAEGRGRAYAYVLDVRDADAWDAFAAGVRADHGVPDIVVNNAGILISGSFLDHATEDWERIVGVNLMGVVHGCRVFAPQMVERGEGGHIVNIASTAAFLPMSSAPAYSTTKSAVKMLSECLRMELRSHDIGVTAICPTVIRTNIGRNGSVVGVDAETERQFSELADRLQGQLYPTGPDKVARAIVRSVRRNSAVVPVNPDAWVIWGLSRVSPSLLRGVAGLVSVERGLAAAEWLYGRVVGRDSPDASRDDAVAV